MYSRSNCAALITILDVNKLAIAQRQLKVVFKLKRQL
jgi:hypothetical protein